MQFSVGHVLTHNKKASALLSRKQLIRYDFSTIPTCSSSVSNTEGLISTVLPSSGSLGSPKRHIFPVDGLVSSGPIKETKMFVRCECLPLETGILWRDREGLQ